MPKRVSLLVMLLLMLGLLPRVALAREYSEKEELQLGKEAAADLEKEYKILDIPDQLKRVDTILKTIAPVTERPNVVYKAKILDTKDVNALSIPGGYVYVTKGLLDDADSDDELAGVLAHEVGHNCHKHALKQLDKSAKIDQQLTVALMVALLVSHDKTDTGSLMLLGQVLKLNALNGYGQEAEFEADHSAVDYLIRSKRYNPVAMLQFMHKLQLEEERRPEQILGIFKTHPDTKLRVERIRAQLIATGISPDVRVPGKSTPTATTRAVTVNGKEIAEISLNGRVLFQPAVSEGGENPAQRAAEYAKRVNSVFCEYAETRCVSVRSEGENRVLLYRDSPLLVVTPADAQFLKSSADVLAEQAAKALRAVIWEDFVRRAY